MKTVKTFTATIYIGLYDTENKIFYMHEHLRSVCKRICGLCVTYTETTFYYEGGSEPGAIIGLINYPRFPSTNEEIKDKAIKLAYSLMRMSNQKKVSVVFSDETVMIEKTDDGGDWGRQ